MSNKKFLCVSLIGWILFIGMFVYAAIITERDVSAKQVNFRLEAGDKVYIFEKGASVRVYCTPKEARKYYLKVPEGKTFSGIWNLRNK